LSAAENVRFMVRAARGDTRAVPPALERLGLNARLQRLPAGKLSAGQRRRVAIAGLLARQPRLWLLDEPHAGLDAEHRELLEAVLREAVARGATVVLASHEIGVSEALADRTVTMSGGTVLDGLLDVASPYVTGPELPGPELPGLATPPGAAAGPLPPAGRSAEVTHVA